MKQIYKTDYQTINLLEDGSIINNVWSPSTATLDEEGFKKEIEHFEAQISQHKPKAILGDTLQLRFPISPEVQQWIGEFLFPSVARAGVKKYAVIVSVDLITQLSVEQTVDEEKSGSFVFRYFSDSNKALEWLRA